MIRNTVLEYRVGIRNGINLAGTFTVMFGVHANTVIKHWVFQYEVSVKNAYMVFVSVALPNS